MATSHILLGFWLITECWGQGFCFANYSSASDEPTNYFNNSKHDIHNNTMTYNIANNSTTAAYNLNDITTNPYLTETDLSSSLEVDTTTTENPNRETDLIVQTDTSVVISFVTGKTQTNIVVATENTLSDELQVPTSLDVEVTETTSSNPDIVISTTDTTYLATSDTQITTSIEKENQTSPSLSNADEMTTEMYQYSHSNVSEDIVITVTNDRRKTTYTDTSILTTQNSAQSSTFTSTLNTDFTTMTNMEADVTTPGIRSQPHQITSQASQIQPKQLTIQETSVKSHCNTTCSNNEMCMYQARSNTSSCTCMDDGIRDPNTLRCSTSVPGSNENDHTSVSPVNNKSLGKSTQNDQETTASLGHEIVAALQENELTVSATYGFVHTLPTEIVIQKNMKHSVPADNIIYIAPSPFKIEHKLIVSFLVVDPQPAMNVYISAKLVVQHLEQWNYQCSALMDMKIESTHPGFSKRGVGSCQLRIKGPDLMLLIAIIVPISSVCVIFIAIWILYVKYQAIKANYYWPTSLPYNRSRHYPVTISAEGNNLASDDECKNEEVLTIDATKEQNSTNAELEKWVVPLDEMELQSPKPIETEDTRV